MRTCLQTKHNKQDRVAQQSVFVYEAQGPVPSTADMGHAGCAYPSTWEVETDDQEAKVIPTETLFKGKQVKERGASQCGVLLTMQESPV